VKRCHVLNFRVFEKRGVKCSCFFGIVIEPQTRGDFLHNDSVYGSPIANDIKGVTPQGEVYEASID
jgi:hypothetical protein